jgi:hypothetical protein
MPESNTVNDGSVATNRGGTMRLFIFKSDSSSDLRAFGGDLVGSQLPIQFKPWHVTGAVAPGEDPPYNLSRDAIETAVKDRGFQLWRLSKKD